MNDFLKKFNLLLFLEYNYKRIFDQIKEI